MQEQCRESITEPFLAPVRRPSLPVNKLQVVVAARHGPQHIQRLLLREPTGEAAAVGQHHCERSLLVPATGLHGPVLGLELGIARLVQDAQQRTEPLVHHPGKCAPPIAATPADPVMW